MSIYVNNNGSVTKANIGYLKDPSWGACVPILGFASVNGNIVKFYDFVEDIDYIEYYLVHVSLDNSRVSSLSELSPYATFTFSTNSDGYGGTIAIRMTHSSAGHHVDAGVNAAIHMKSTDSSEYRQKLYMYKLTTNAWGNYIPYESSVTSSISYSRISSGSWNINCYYLNMAHNTFIDLGSSSSTKTVVFSNNNPGTGTGYEQMYLNLGVEDGYNASANLSMKLNYIKLNGRKIPIKFTHSLT